MKKITLFATLLLFATNCFASGNSEFETIMGFISLVLFILGVIFFFRIWSMTNDVLEIKNDLKQQERDYLWKSLRFASDRTRSIRIREHILLGDTESVKYYFLQSFIKNIKEASAKLEAKKIIYVKDDNGVEKEEINNQLFEESIRPYVEALKKQYSIIGEEIPSYIQRMNTFDDYLNLFTQDDLKVKTNG